MDRDWSSDVCSSDLDHDIGLGFHAAQYDPPAGIVHALSCR
jgi:hypothetical protein